MIWIIGGTSETKLLLGLLPQKDSVVVSVATETGTAFIDHDDIIVGRMDVEAMTSFIQSRNITVVADLSHPYAYEVTRNVQEACLKTATTYARYIRESSDSNDMTTFSSMEKCVAHLEKIEGTVFFTTGSKYISEIEKIRGDNRFIYRVLPAVESMEVCRENQLEYQNIIAALGPFSVDMNVAMFKEYRADYVVMKNSGDRGGTKEKIMACRELGIIPLMIEREEESGFTDLQTLAKFLNQAL